MADTTFIGSTLSVYKGDLPLSSGVVDTNSSNWGSSGTLVEISNVQTIGELGDTHTPIEYNILKEGRVKRLPGATDGGVVPISAVYDEDDITATKGQGIILAGNGQDDPHQFIAADADGTKYGFSGTLADWRWAARDNTTVKMFTFNIYVTSPIYTLT